jgi:hypothetical protein
MPYQLFWGDLHSHCSISYGHGTVEQALLRAKQQLDFCSVTGHAFWPDMPTDRTRYAEIIDYHTRGFTTLAGNWERLLARQAGGSRPGQFLAFPSYEWHSLEFGDHNVYGPGPELKLQDAPDLPALRRVVAEAGGIAIPHHIGYRAGYRGINWDAYEESLSPFVEIFSLHGCSLSDDAPYPMLHDMGPRDAGSTAEEGWRRGFRFGIVGGTDHHAAYPGSHGDGRMGLFARELTREAIWEAFLARRVFAATGDRIDARLFLNDAWIGETVRSAGTRNLRVIVAGPAALDRVELLKNGRVVQRWFPGPVDVDERRRRYKLRITWGWGRNTVPVEWHADLRLSDGAIRDVETHFAGQAIVAPKGAAGSAGPVLDEVDLPHQVTAQDERRCRWRSVTMGNKTMRHETTQSITLDLAASLTDRVQITVNGRGIDHPLGELLRCSRSHFLRGWLSEALCVGPLVPVEECCVDACYDDEPDRERDVYRLQAAQQNGQWAWLTPIWAER